MTVSNGRPRLAFALVGLVLAAASAAAPPITQYDKRAKAEYGPIFAEVLKKFIGEHSGPNICLPPLFGFGENVTESVDVQGDPESPLPAVRGSATQQAQFKALEAAGLVSGTPSTRTVNGKELRSITYRRTPKGLAASQGPSICYARGELDRVVKWKGPVALGEYQAAFVYYTVKTAHIEDWAQSKDIQAAFPVMTPILKGEDTKVRQVVIDLSSEGWDIAEFSKYLQMQ